MDLDRYLSSERVLLVRFTKLSIKIINVLLSSTSNFKVKKKEYHHLH